MPAIAGLKEVAKKKAPKNTLIRITDDAAEWARIAASYSGESVPDYVSRVISEQARRDTEKLHAERIKAGGKGPKG